MALRLGLRQGSVVAASRLGAAHCVPARPIAVRAARLQLAMVPATAMTRATWSGSSSIEELPEELPPRPPAPTTGQHVHHYLAAGRVHVSPAGGWQLDQLKRLCHNYVLVETWLQRLAPKPLRGSDDCRSNVQALVSPSGRSRQDVLDAVLAAESIEELVELMCPVGNTSYGLDLRPVLERGDVAFRLPADWCDAVDGVDALIKLWKRLVAWAADISRPLINPRLSVEHAMRRLWPPALRRVLRMWAKRAAS